VFTITCFVDFSKAFDRVNYWKLFIKLLNDNVDYSIVRVLAYWYSNQECRVRWCSSLAGCFYMSNGTRQGGVLSPYLFSRYVRDMIRAVTDAGVGCKVANHVVNILAYADDLVLISPSWRALQTLISVLYAHALEISMTLNTHKNRLGGLFLQKPPQSYC